MTRGQDNVVYFDNITFSAASAAATAATGLGPLDFEPDGLGGAYAWAVFENVDNPPLEIIPNPDAIGHQPVGDGRAVHRAAGRVPRLRAPTPRICRRSRWMRATRSSRSWCGSR